MKDFFLALYNIIIAIEGVKYCRMWNQQLRLVQEGKMEAFEHPAVFIEFVTAEVFQGGEGVQIYDPLLINIHILHWELDAGDGTFEQNLSVYTLKDTVFKALQKLAINTETVPASALVRISEQQDYDHAGVYHYIQSYKCTLTEKAAQEPVGGADWLPVPMPGEVQVETNKADDNEPYIYSITPEGE